MKNTHKTLLFILIFILTIINVTAGNDYPTLGYNYYNSYMSSGTLYLNETVSTFITGTHTLNQQVPIISDLDHDGNNEIVVIASSNILYVQNFTGTTFNNLASLSLGAQINYYTPDIIDYDLDGNREIITINDTAWLILSYNISTGLTVEKSAAIPTPTTNSKPMVIKCSLTQNYGGIVACYALYNDAGTVKLMTYDLTNNTVTGVVVTASWTSYQWDMYRNLHIKDINNDGIREVVFGIWNAGVGNYRVYYGKQTGATTLTITSVYNITTQPNYFFSDLALGNFDGISTNGLEVGVFYQDASNSYNAVVVSRTGSVKKSSFSMTQVKTGTQTALNLPVISKSSQDEFCAYVYNSTVTFSSDTTSSYWCFNANAGTANEIEEITTGYSYSTGSTYGTYSLVSEYNFGEGIINGNYASKFISTSLFTFEIFSLVWSPTEVSLIPFYTSNPFTHAAVIDIRRVGRDDVLYSSSTSYGILNTFGGNSPPEITSYGLGTGDPSCLNVVQKYRITLDDEEGDSIVCHFGFYEINGSLISEQVKTQLVNTQFEFLKTLNTVGSFVSTITCGDSYNPNATSHSFTQTVINATVGCNLQDVGGSSTSTSISAVVVADTAFETDLENTYSAVGLESHKKRNLLGAFILLLIIGFSFYKLRNVLITAAIALVSTLVLFLANLLSIFPLIVMIIVCIGLIVFSLMRNNSSGG